LKGIYLDLWRPGRCSLEHCPAMRWWGLPAVAAGFHSPAQQTCEADCRSAPTRCWPVKGQSHREGFRFQPRACDNCRLKSLQFFSFLAFYPEPVTTELRQRSVPRLCSATRSPPGQQVPAANEAAIIPTPGQRGFQRNPILPGAHPRARRRPVLVFLGRSLALGPGPRYVEGRKGSGGKRSTSETPGATGGPVTADHRGRPRSRSRALNLPNASHGT
jgi:hypothetical protein